MFFKVNKYTLSHSLPHPLKSHLPRAMPTASRFTKPKRAAFLARLAETANVSASCVAAGVSRYAACALKRRDAEFAQAWEGALQTALDGLEAELIRRAIEGTDKPQYYMGKPVGMVTTYSDSLAMFLLKSKRPDVYGDLKAVSQAPRESDDDAYNSAFERLVSALDARAAGQAPEGN